MSVDGRPRGGRGAGGAPSNDKLRVLFVTPRYWPYVGGVETHTAEVARRLAAAGHEVTVLTTDPGGALPPVERVAGVRIERARAWPAGGDYYFAPGVYRRIARGGRRWDLVHCQGYHTLVPPLAMLAARRAGLPYLVSFHSGGHSSRLRTAIRDAQRAALRPLLARAAHLVAVSAFEAAFFRARLRLPAERFAVIPNGAHLPEAAPAPADGAGGTLLLSVGRLERYKGHQRAIAALPHLLEHRPDARLRIVGTGPYEGELRRFAAALGLASRVEIAGVDGADRAGMARLLSCAALVLLLSDYEAHPIAVMEALALGRPVLVAHTSGLIELADRGLVRSVPPASAPAAVATTILANLRDPLVPVGVRLPTWEDCVAALVALYRTVGRRAACVS